MQFSTINDVASVPFGCNSSATTRHMFVFCVCSIEGVVHQRLWSEQQTARERKSERGRERDENDDNDDDDGDDDENRVETNLIALVFLIDQVVEFKILPVSSLRFENLPLVFSEEGPRETQYTIRTFRIPRCDLGHCMCLCCRQ